jgi:hypothetical protein
MCYPTDEIKARERRAKQRIRLLEKMVPLAKDRARLKAELDRKRYEGMGRAGSLFDRLRYGMLS